MMIRKARIEDIDRIVEIYDEIQSEKDRYTLAKLIDSIEERGPVQPGFMNYSKLSNTEYHCHLSYHWVACWRCEDGKYLVEVYYVGSRESAPY